MHACSFFVGMFGLFFLASYILSSTLNFYTVFSSPTLSSILALLCSVHPKFAICMQRLCMHQLVRAGHKCRSYPVVLFSSFWGYIAYAQDCLVIRQCFMMLFCACMETLGTNEIFRIRGKTSTTHVRNELKSPWKTENNVIQIKLLCKYFLFFTLKFILTK